MDDFIILSTDINILRNAYNLIKGFLEEVLFLQLNPKTRILDCKYGVEFVGFIHFGDHKILKERTMKTIYNAIYSFDRGYINEEQLYNKWQSWRGHASHADSYQFMQVIQTEIEKRIDIKK